ncbi:amidase [Acidimangrovimonas sediminis]|uniref:amidase n=1 Tax=Acidimangrovimonas sediminis TaxID=2056283 RepID=UPI000C7FB312|nr:amidase [Acidimangrovimonas sediminis]
MADLWKLTAGEMVAGIRAGTVTARALAEAALARIDATNPDLTAVVQRFDAEALAAADAVDAALARGEDPGPMAGVPVTIKVNIDQKGQANTNGLRIQSGMIATEDNPVVANFRKAGAVIVGRTNTPAFSMRWFTRNSLHGHTRNPFNPALTPGGSSGGAASSVAAGMAPIAHGNDIAGSVRYPAYACGLHGLRPSMGRVSSFNASAGDRHIGAQLMSVQGPLARSIDDLRLALEVMSGRDMRDPWWMPAPLTGPAVPKRAALCLAPDGMAVAPEIRDALKAAAARLADAGWEVEETALPPLREVMDLQIALWLADFRRTGGAAIRAEDDPDATFVYDNLCRRVPAGDLNAFMDILQTRAGAVRAWRAFFERFPVALLPVSGELPFADQRDVASEADFDAVVEAQMPMISLPFMGLPGLTVTTGRVETPLGPSPVGVQIVADQFREDLLLEAGGLIGDTVPVLAPAIPAP